MPVSYSSDTRSPPRKRSRSRIARCTRSRRDGSPQQQDDHVYLPGEHYSFLLVPRIPGIPGISFMRLMGLVDNDAAISEGQEDLGDTPIDDEFIKILTLTISHIYYPKYRSAVSDGLYTYEQHPA